ncbi:hypothetical protein GZ77_23460 [Endozoicomonas montiporae]|uniref:Uncharacterized protein n=1 Tax=Endozoicomonas montiporae TaxID=1027273 RepID=A0A081N0R8_9GAMM|nr:hypothetical protein [Endozoicomonas montiporae]KEQ12041.1 hypothetical protein GZ77_23460 [Endozoicomonas montiporae]
MFLVSIHLSSGLLAHTYNPPRFFAIFPKNESFNVYANETAPSTNTSVSLQAPVYNPGSGAVIKNHLSPHPEGSIDWSTISPNRQPSAVELKKAQRKLKILIPALSLAALSKYVFAGELIDTTGNSYSQYYDSLLVLGGSNYLADGMAELLNEVGLDIISSRGAALIIMLVPAESRAIYNDITLNMKQLSFAEAMNHYAIKSASNQASHLAIELALPYVRQHIETGKYPGLDKMLATAATSTALAALPLFLQIAIGMARGGEIKAGKMAIDSSIGFMYSVAVNNVKKISQQAAHAYLDGAKDKPWCNPELQNCKKIDQDNFYSELFAGALCFASAHLVDHAASIVPSGMALKTTPVPVLSRLVNSGIRTADGGIKATPKIMAETAKILRKISAYAASDALKKKLEHTLPSYTSESESMSNLITIVTNLGLSYVASSYKSGRPYKTGFGVRSVNAAYNLGIMAAVKVAYSTGLDQAIGLSGPLNIPWDYYAKYPGTSLTFKQRNEQSIVIPVLKLSE